MTDELAALRTFTLNKSMTPPPDDHDEIAALEAEIQRLKDRLILREGEIRGRDAANRVLGEQLAYARERINELSAGARKGTGLNPEFVRAESFDADGPS